MIDIDAVIDNAAARLTDAAPSDDLRARVMARIAMAHRSRMPWRYVLAGGALVGAALIGVVGLRSASPVAMPGADSTRASAAPDPTHVPLASSPLPSVTTARVEQEHAGTSARATVANVTSVTNVANVTGVANSAMGAAETAWRARATPALARPAALEVDSLELRSIDITPLGVAPLVVPPLGDGQDY